MRKPLTLLLGILCMFGQLASAQQSNTDKDPLAQKMHLYKLANPSPTLFLHFDKNIYSNSEIAWFTGYLIEDKPEILSAHQMLSVAMVRNTDSVIIKQQHFLINNGLSFGDFKIPDSILAGSYHFMASTNQVSNGKPEAIFIQPITIKTNQEPLFKAALKILEPGKEGKPTQLLLSVTTPDFRFLPGPVQVNYKYGNEQKKAKTNPSGELLFEINEQPDLNNPNIYVQLKYKKDSTVLQLPLPAVAKRKAKVGFYPEGGTLVNGILSQVAWEVKDNHNAAVSLKAELLKDNEVVETIETNSYGMGKFMLYPEKGSKYSVKLAHNGFMEVSYPLPTAIDEGLVMQIKDALPTDTLRMNLRSKKEQLVNVRIHNFRETFLFKEIKVKDGGTALKIPLNEVSKGLKTITITDASGRPLAERMVFTHYDASKKIEVTTDQSVYTPRSKVTLTLNLKGGDSLGLVSVACVQNNRLAQNLATDIESYTYISKELNGLPPGGIDRIYENKDYLTHVLLIKGWRKYTWQDLEQVKSTDTIRKYQDVSFPLLATWNKQPLKKPVSVGLMLGEELAINKTDEHGHLKLTVQDLLVGSNEKTYAFINEKQAQQFYEIKFEDPFIALNKSYLKLFPFEAVNSFSTVENSSILTLKGNEKILQLKEVTINSNNDEDYLGNFMPRGRTNHCGDYVCTFNILNCPNHVYALNNRSPMVGASYYKDGTRITYQDCTTKTVKKNTLLHPISGVYTKREFYVDDYSIPGEPAIFSTLYWNHMVVVPASEVQNLTFYTGDILGKFKVVVQGISKNNMLYAEQQFEVKGKDK